MDSSLVWPTDWAFSEWSSCDFGDKRLTARTVRVGSALLSRSALSLPKQMEDWSDLMGAYRLLGNPRVTHEALSVPHWEQTRRFANSPDLGVVLFIQDSTTLRYGNHRETSGLGFVGNGQGYGIELHNMLCVLPGDIPQLVGLAHQTPWTRDHPPLGKAAGDAARRNRRTEHDIWKETVEAIGPAPANESGTFWVSVGDRGSDVFSYMSRASALGWHTVVRSKFDRVLADRLEGEEEERRLLHGRLRGLPALAETLVSLRARPGVPARVVRLKVAWTAVVLPRPRRKDGGDPLPMNAIRVWEDRMSSGKPEPLEWILLTSLPLESLERVLEVIGYYRNRWLIEEYHKCLKTGCNLEKRQVATKHKLFALVALFSVVSIYLLRFKTPLDDTRVPPQLVQILRLLKPTDEDLSEPKIFWRTVAMLGGFLGRKGDGDPGWQTIWSGWNRIQDVLVGIQIAENRLRTRCV